MASCWRITVGCVSSVFEHMLRKQLEATASEIRYTCFHHTRWLKQLFHHPRCKTCCNKSIRILYLHQPKCYLPLVAGVSMSSLVLVKAPAAKKVENQAFQARTYQDIHRRTCRYLWNHASIISTRCEEALEDVIFIRSNRHFANWNTNLTCIISRQDITKVSVILWSLADLISCFDMTCL